MCLNIYKKNVRSEAWPIAQTTTPSVPKKSNSGYVSGNRQSQKLAFFFPMEGVDKHEGQQDKTSKG